MESKEYSHAWVTSSQCLRQGRCELIAAYLVASGATTDSVLYDGDSTAGSHIITLKSAVVTNLPFEPPVPIYCERGLYVTVGTSVTGILVIWRNLK